MALKSQVLSSTKVSIYSLKLTGSASQRTSNTIIGSIQIGPSAEKLDIKNEPFSGTMTRSTWSASKPYTGHSTISWNQKFQCKKMLQFFKYCEGNQAKQTKKIHQYLQNTVGNGLELTNAKTGLYISHVSKKLMRFLRNQGRSRKKRENCPLLNPHN